MTQWKDLDLKNLCFVFSFMGYAVSEMSVNVHIQLSFKKLSCEFSINLDS